MRTPSGTFDLEAVYVGSGTQADFAHRRRERKGLTRVRAASARDSWSPARAIGTGGDGESRKKLGAAAASSAGGPPGNWGTHAVEVSAPAIPAHPLGDSMTFSLFEQRHPALGGLRYDSGFKLNWRRKRFPVSSEICHVLVVIPWSTR